MALLQDTAEPLSQGGGTSGKHGQNTIWDNRKSFHHYIHNEILSKKNVGALPDGAADLVTANTAKAGVLNFFFAPVFSCKVSQASVISRKLQG